MLFQTKGVFQLAISPSDEVSVAESLVHRLYPFGSYLAGSVVPPCYEAYARILHPAPNAHGDYEVRWSEIAQ